MIVAVQPRMRDGRINDMRIVLASLLILVPLTAARSDVMPAPEAVTLKCGYEIFDVVGEEVWPGWKAAPFSTLLIHGEEELLISTAPEVSGFAPAGESPVPGFLLFRRARVFDPRLLATFPATGSEPTIVVGTPSSTGKTDAAWMITLLHEHFHQLQYSQPGYYEQTAALNLAKGDTTGMWMLNYPFPYDDAAVGQRFEQFASALGEGLRLRGAPGFAGALREVKSRWRELRESLEEDDYAYLRFQLWQEGVARYVELTVAERAASRGAGIGCAASIEPPLSQVAEQLLTEIRSGLESPRLAGRERVAFYAAGAAIAALLEETSPDWKRRYFDRPFLLETYFAP